MLKITILQLRTLSSKTKSIALIFYFELYFYTNSIPSSKANTREKIELSYPEQTVSQLKSIHLPYEQTLQIKLLA